MYNGRDFEFHVKLCTYSFEVTYQKSKECNNANATCFDDDDDDDDDGDDKCLRVCVCVVWCGVVWCGVCVCVCVVVCVSVVLA